VTRVSPSLIEIDPRIKIASVLPDRICAILKHRILTCEILPGARLVERDLCAELRVSRTPLREALNRLVYEDLVVPTPYRGYAVAPLTVESIRELCEVRRINEAQAAWLAAQRLGDGDLEQLEPLARARYAGVDRESYAEFLRNNCAFHLALVRCTRNSRLESIVMAALDLLQRPEYLGLDGGGRNARAVELEHLGIVQALRERDGDRARALMVEHLSRGEERILAALEATDFWKQRHPQPAAPAAVGATSAAAPGRLS
jgi:DNA-binding GntR family transcriptional regulator